MEKKTLPPNPSRLIEGLRDTGYNFNTALADIVDNSVDAEATVIDIQIKMDQTGYILITVADNGCGMNKNELLDGMTYGAQGRVDPRRLGKFGLGLKTASTAFCRKLSVITRPSANDSPMKAIWDLDHVAKVSEWELLIGDPSKEEISCLDKVASESSGTLVVWENVDRLLKDYVDPAGHYAFNALDRFINDFISHVSMIYQRFLDHNDDRARNITITVNGHEVDAWDPFCIQESETEMVAGEVKQATIDDNKKASFMVRAYVLPRKEQFSSDVKAKQARLENKYQGVYVYRENRMIHPHDWLGMFTKEPHYTLLRVEFSFNHELDDAFWVDIKKSRILLNETLYDYLKKFLTPPRNAADERYRKGQRKKANDAASGAHNESNKNISSKESTIRLAEVGTTWPDSNEADVTNKSGTSKIKIDVGTSVNNNVYIETVDSIDDGFLWIPSIINGNRAIKLNTSHDYYRKVYVPNINHGVTIQGLDSLLWALSEAELGTVNDATQNHFRELRYEVSRLLRALVKDLPEPNFEDENANA